MYHLAENNDGGRAGQPPRAAGRPRGQSQGLVLTRPKASGIICGRTKPLSAALFETATGGASPRAAIETMPEIHSRSVSMNISYVLFFISYIDTTIIPHIRASVNEESCRRLGLSCYIAAVGIERVQ